MNSPTRMNSLDWSDVEWLLIDYFGTQGKAWTIDELLTVQEVLGYKYTGMEPDGVDPRLRRFYDTAPIKDPVLFLHQAAGILGTGPVTAKALDVVTRMLAREYRKNSRFWDVPEALDGFREKRYGLAMTSDVSALSVERLFYGKDKFARTNFRHLVLSCEVGSVKREGQLFRVAAEKIGVAPAKCLVVDDSVHAIVAAVNLGMKAVFIDREDRTEEEIAQLNLPPGVAVIGLLTDLLDLLPDRT